MECEQLKELKRLFLEARGKWVRAAHERDLAPEELGQLSEGELEALLALLDHRAEHGCQGPAAQANERTLPAGRNMGGIIGPW
jgi:hypothetical protein